MSIHSENTNDDLQYRQLQLGQNLIVKKLGNQTLIMKKYKGRFWWGLSIVNAQGQQYYTHKAVKFDSKLLVDRIFRDFVMLKRQFYDKKITKTYEGSIMLIIDQYKGHRYVGIRHYNYYADNIQPTRYGFNLRWNQFEGFMRKTQAYLK